MSIHLELRKQIYLVLAGLMLIVLAGGLAIIHYSKQVEAIMLEIVDKELVKYQVIEEMEASLVNQKGFVTYFYMDRDPSWLEQLGAFRQVFKERLGKIELLDQSESETGTIREVRENYQNYIDNMNRVIAHYKKGEIKQGYDLHLQVRNSFFRIQAAFRLYKQAQIERIQKDWDASRKQGRKLITSVILTCIAALVVILLLVALLITRILNPLLELSREARRDVGGISKKDLIQQLSLDVHGLIEDADSAQEKLQQSREILIQSEKLALVGKLAAGMAHSIRNPLTSVKMRLFSLGRTLDMNESQNEDFEVISEEIRHLDIIVQNFLEFSRPPKLTMQPASLSSVVDQSLQLLEHRLRSYNVVVEVDRITCLPEIQCDPEQLKEVFVNLIVNACEAIKSGGKILIEEREENDSQSRTALVRIIDDGPGIPESVIGSIFQPFFTTKEEGTGLGLSIAERIIADHGGSIQVTSRQDEGTTFILAFPIRGD